MGLTASKDDVNPVKARFVVVADVVVEVTIIRFVIVEVAELMRMPSVAVRGER